MEERDRGVIQVQMLGGFSLTWEGREYILGRNSSAKYLQLLQLVWLQGEKGISKEQILQALYDRETLSNSSNSLSNLIYQLRRQMVRAGLPQGEYISRKEGVYRIPEDLELQIDALEFKRLAAEGEALGAGGDREGEMGCLRKAFELYRGSLLPSNSTELWVMNESLVFKGMFESCVRRLGAWYKERRDYQAMDQIYRKAAGLYPFDDWQTGQIDSLMCRGEYKEAYALYEKTVSLYSEEMGLPPSARLMKCYEEMGNRLSGSGAQLLEILSELKETAPLGQEGDGDKNTQKFGGGGAYYCSYPAFVDVYRLLRRTMDRSSCPISLMLCTVVDYEGKQIRSPEKLKARSEAMGAAIRQSLRQGDAYTRYTASQYLVLLVGTTREGCEIVFRRLLRRFRELAGPRAEAQYHVISLGEE